MSKIKGLKKLNKAVSAELEPFGIKKAFCGTEYSFSWINESISFKITEGTIEDIWFLEFVKNRFGIEPQSFIISILHEVGHYRANDEIEGAIFDFCMTEKNRISAEMQTADEVRSKELEFEYFNLPDEIMATQWAVNYIKNNPEHIKIMWHNIQKALRKFYKKNEVTED